MNNRELVLSYLNAFTCGDPDVVVGHVHDDFENIQVSVLGSSCKGKQIYRQRLKKFLTEFSNLEYHPDDLIVEGDRVAAPYTMTFIQNERAFDIQGVMVITIRDDRIAVRRDYWDGLAYQRQAGR